MGVLRGLTLSMVALLPALFLGLLAYLIMGGSSDTTEWDTWMYIPCYGVPLFCLFVAFIFGMRSGRVEDQ
ncbi:MAG: hypothetical protein CMA62_02715 [Euryarchaeota archaeon]|nr:hypothetical protein [Euryarchaeota archaeon]MBT86416.1 hypothetical protein [Euryarchaeota archaeon]DAC46761.1 MAG TPA: hypothetical protein D7H82_03195 [Candidatus Poseidoniales archaeon]HII33890.1 hypothetical protein [Candidatus Thalassarchaeaceae archaeon]